MEGRGNAVSDLATGLGGASSIPAVDDDGNTQASTLGLPHPQAHAKNQQALVEALANLVEGNFTGARQIATNALGRRGTGAIGEAQRTRDVPLPEPTLPTRRWENVMEAGEATPPDSGAGAGAGAGAGPTYDTPPRVVESVGPVTPWKSPLFTPPGAVAPADPHIEAEKERMVATGIGFTPERTVNEMNLQTHFQEHVLKGVVCVTTMNSLPPILDGTKTNAVRALEQIEAFTGVPTGITPLPSGGVNAALITGLFEFLMDVDMVAAALGYIDPDTRAAVHPNPFLLEASLIREFVTIALEARRPRLAFSIVGAARDARAYLAEKELETASTWEAIHPGATSTVEPPTVKTVVDAMIDKAFTPKLPGRLRQHIFGVFGIDATDRPAAITPQVTSFVFDITQVYTNPPGAPLSRVVAQEQIKRGEWPVGSGDFLAAAGRISQAGSTAAASVALFNLFVNPHLAYVFGAEYRSSWPNSIWDDVANRPAKLLPERAETQLHLIIPAFIAAATMNRDLFKHDLGLIYVPASQLTDWEWSRRHPNIAFASAIFTLHEHAQAEEGVMHDADDGDAPTGGPPSPISINSPPRVVRTPKFEDDGSLSFPSPPSVPRNFGRTTGVFPVPLKAAQGLDLEEATGNPVIDNKPTPSGFSGSMADSNLAQAHKDAEKNKPSALSRLLHSKAREEARRMKSRDGVMETLKKNRDKRAADQGKKLASLMDPHAGVSLYANPDFPLGRHPGDAADAHSNFGGAVTGSLTRESTHDLQTRLANEERDARLHLGIDPTLKAASQTLRAATLPARLMLESLASRLKESTLGTLARVTPPRHQDPASRFKTQTIRPEAHLRGADINDCRWAIVRALACIAPTRRVRPGRPRRDDPPGTPPPAGRAPRTIAAEHVAWTVEPPAIPGGVAGPEQWARAVVRYVHPTLLYPLINSNTTAWDNLGAVLHADWGDMEDAMDYVLVAFNPRVGVSPFQMVGELQVVNHSGPENPVTVTALVERPGSYGIVRTLDMWFTDRLHSGFCTAFKDVVFSDLAENSTRLAPPNGIHLPQMLQIGVDTKLCLAPGILQRPQGLLAFVLRALTTVEGFEEIRIVMTDVFNSHLRQEQEQKARERRRNNVASYLKPLLGNRKDPNPRRKSKLFTFRKRAPKKDPPPTVPSATVPAVAASLSGASITEAERRGFTMDDALLEKYKKLQRPDMDTNPFLTQGSPLFGSQGTEVDEHGRVVGGWNLRGPSTLFEPKPIPPGMADANPMSKTWTRIKAPRGRVRNKKPAAGAGAGAKPEDVDGYEWWPELHHAIMMTINFAVVRYYQSTPESHQDPPPGDLSVTFNSSIDLVDIQAVHVEDRNSLARTRLVQDMGDVSQGLRISLAGGMPNILVRGLRYRHVTGLRGEESEPPDRNGRVDTIVQTDPPTYDAVLANDVFLDVIAVTDTMTSLPVSQMAPGRPVVPIDPEDLVSP